MTKQNNSEEMDTRREWLNWLDRLSKPVLRAASEGALASRMPNENPSRSETISSEALARTLAGIAPFLKGQGGNPHEDELRRELTDLAREAISREIKPDSSAWTTAESGYTQPRQQLVECAFLAEAVLRAPDELYFKLDQAVRERLVDVFEASRKVIATGNNWILFSAMVEAALKRIGRPWDSMRVAFAVNQFAQWYTGDSSYGDGNYFHFDFYNSFVIHPFLLEIVQECEAEGSGFWIDSDVIQQRAQRHSAVLERMIAPDGSWPVLGRSMAYRTGCFHLLSLLSLQEALPPDLSPAQVRCALTAALRRSIGAENTFDKAGWLRIGLCGSQPSLGEQYINNGSIYLCCQVLLPLGLPEESPFWSEPDKPWTSVQAWSGRDVAADKALNDK